jgi:hypothetical protein
MNYPRPAFSAVVLLLSLGAGHWLSRNAEVAAPEPSTTKVQKAPVLDAAAVEVARTISQVEKSVVADMPGLWAEAWAEFTKTQPDQASWFAAKTAAREKLTLILLRWAELDPAAAIAFFSDPAAAEAERQFRCRGIVLAAWAEKDLNAALDAAEAIPPVENKEGSYQSHPADIAGETLLWQNPGVFWEWFKVRRKPLPSLYMARDARWLKLAQQYPDELLAVAKELANVTLEEGAAKNGGKTRMREPEWAAIYQLLAQAKAETDLQAALAWAKEVPPEARNRALKSVLEKLIELDPKQAWDELKELKSVQTGPNSYSGSGADDLVDQVIAKMGREDPKELLAWLKDGKLGGSGSGVDRVSVDASQIANVCRQAMATGKMTTEEVFTALRGGKEDGGLVRLNVLPKMYQGLPVDTLRQAGQELLASDSKSSKPHALAGVVAAWMDQDAAGAHAFLAGISDPETRKTIGLQLARKFSYQNDPANPLTAEEIKSRLPADVRAAALANRVDVQYGSGMANYNSFSQGIEAIAESLADTPEGKDKTSAFSRLGEAWGSYDPLEASRWAAGLADVNLQKAALATAGDAWAEQDEFGFSQWLEAQPPGTPRDVGASRLSRSLRATEPDSAWAWAGSIADPAARSEAQADVLRVWGKQSPAEARAAAEAAWQANADLEAVFADALNKAATGKN